MDYLTKIEWKRNFIKSLALKLLKIAQNIPFKIYFSLRPILVQLSALILSPFLFTIFILINSIYFSLYKRLHKNEFRNGTFWERPIRNMSKFWMLHGLIWHGHEIVGFENIPNDGPAILILLHGTLPIDFFYLGANVLLRKNRLIRVVTERDAFNKFGGENIIEALELTPGSRESCIQYLRENQLVVIAPGGLREALYSRDYNLLWAGRNGFAKVAKETKVPIIPIFTKNSQETTYRFQIFRKLFQYIYEITRIGFVPTFGWFPVKLTTYIGKPIEYDESRSVEELARLTEYEIKKLIKKHQKIPGNIFYAIVERIKNQYLNNLLSTIGRIVEKLHEFIYS